MNYTDERYVNRRRDPDGNIEWEESDFFERDLLEEGEVELIDDVDALRDKANRAFRDQLVSVR